MKEVKEVKEIALHIPLLPAVITGVIGLALGIVFPKIVSAFRSNRD